MSSRVELEAGKKHGDFVPALCQTWRYEERRDFNYHFTRSLGKEESRNFATPNDLKRRRFRGRLLPQSAHTCARTS